MPHIQSESARGIQPIVMPGTASEVTAKRYSINVTAAQLTVNNIFELAPIPPNCRVVDMTLDCTDIDTNGTPVVALDVGIMTGEFGDNTQTRTCGSEFFQAAPVGQAGGIARLATLASVKTGGAPIYRSIGVRVLTAPATPVAGNIGLTVYVVPID